MTRSLDSSAVTESQKGFNSLVTLVEVVVDTSNPTYLTDYARDLVVSGKTYLSAQGLMSVTSVTEDSQNTINRVDVVLSGITDEFISDFLDFDYIDRPVAIKKQFVNPNTDALVGGEFLIFDGRIDKPVISHSFNTRTASIGISCSSHWSNFARKNNRHTNDLEQQSHFSGDNCFKFSIDFDKELNWGQAT